MNKSFEWANRGKKKDNERSYSKLAVTYCVLLSNVLIVMDIVKEGDR